MKRKHSGGSIAYIAILVLWALIVALFAIAPYLIIDHFIIKYW